MASSGRTELYQLPYPLTNDVVDVAGDITLLAVRLDQALDEIIEDVAGAMVDGGSETGIQVTYSDNGVGKGKLNFSLLTPYLLETTKDLLTHTRHTNVTANWNATLQIVELTAAAGGGGGGGTGSASLADIWWLGV